MASYDLLVKAELYCMNIYIYIGILVYLLKSYSFMFLTE